MQRGRPRPRRRWRGSPPSARGRRPPDRDRGRRRGWGRTRGVDGEHAAGVVPEAGQVLLFKDPVRQFATGGVDLRVGDVGVLVGRPLPRVPRRIVLGLPALKEVVEQPAAVGRRDEHGVALGVRQGGAQLLRPRPFGHALRGLVNQHPVEPEGDVGIPPDGQVFEAGAVAELVPERR